MISRIVIGARSIYFCSSTMNFSWLIEKEPTPLSCVFNVLHFIAHSWRQLILLFEVFECNIHIKGQELIFDRTNIFITILSFLEHTQFALWRYADIVYLIYVRIIQINFLINVTNALLRCTLGHFYDFWTLIISWVNVHIIIFKPIEVSCRSLVITKNCNLRIYTSK